MYKLKPGEWKASRDLTVVEGCRDMEMEQKEAHAPTARLVQNSWHTEATFCLLPLSTFVP